MKTLLVVAALAALCALPLPVRARAALGSSKDAAKDAAKDPAEQCACQSDSNRPQQLIRGADQVSRCQKGDYCDCEAKTVANCDMSFMGETGRLNEDEQMCDFTFDCQAFFDRPTESPRTREPTLPTLPTEAAETTAAAPTPPPEPCTCENATDASRPQQLIRGADQVSRCQKGDYCDCGAKAVVHCDMSFMGETGRFNEDEQMCDFTFDCQAFFRGPTARPPTAATRTPAPTARPTAQPTAAPTPPPQACTCAVAGGPPLQLVRGDLAGVTELALCQRGDYCHCESKTLRNCGFSFLGQTAKLNEDQQMCDFLSDCEASLHATVGTTSRTSSRTTAGTSSRTTAGTSSRTTDRTASTPSGWVPYPASGSSRMTLSATLFSLTAVLTVFNLLLLYRRACWPNRAAPFVRLRPGVPSAVPTVCYPGPALANHTPKLQLESAA